MNVFISAIIALTLSVGGWFGLSYIQPQNNLGALSILKPSQGGTGIGTAIAGDVGTCLKVLDDSPFAFELGSCGGAGGSGTVSTSTNETAGNLAYWTSNSGTPARLGEVATTTLTASSPLSLSQAISVIGSSASALSIDTSGAWSGTAGSLAANGANCSSGSYPLGVDASGASEGCTDATTEINSAISTHASDADAHQDLVTLAGSLDYITLVGQVITRNAIDLANDITGTLGVSNGGTGITSFGTGIATWLGTPSISNFFSALTGEASGVETFLTTPSSSNFFSMVTGETGSGAVVGGTSPTITSPTLSTFFGTPCTGNEFLQDIGDTGAFTCGAASGSGFGQAFEFINSTTLAPTTTNAGIGIQADFFTATSTTATSTFVNGYVSNIFQIGTTTPFSGNTDALLISGEGNRYLTIVGDENEYDYGFRMVDINGTTFSDWNPDGISLFAKDGDQAYVFDTSLTEGGVFRLFNGNGADYTEITSNAAAARAVVFRDADGTVILSGDTFTGDVTGTLDTDGSTALAIGSGVIIEPDLSADNSPTDGDYLQYDSTGTNFVWRSISELITEATSAIQSLIDGYVSGGRSLTYSSGTINADAELYTYNIPANLFATSTANGISTTTEAFLSVQVANASTITGFTCYADDTGTSTIRASISSNGISAGSDILYTTGVNCGAQQEIATSTFSATAVSADDWIHLYVSDAEPTGSRPRVIYTSFELTKND